MGLNGSAAEAGDPANKLALNPAPSSADTEWAAVNAYVQTIRSPRAPTNLDATKVSAGAALFAADGNCVGCHSGPKWTISKVFYAPAAIDSTTGLELNQSLFTTQWGALNGLPASVLPSTAGAGAPGQVMRFAGTSAAAFDQLLCELRNVGTFGVAETGAGIAELRIDMKTAAQGAGTVLGTGLAGIGYNVPSLFGLSVGAPYFHAGNVRTLEALFLTPDGSGGQLFQAHHRALAPNFLTDSDPTAVQTKVDQIVAYLLSIDASTAPASTPSLGASGGSFCHFP
jgi:mono/diheme cytochrome c family protein